MNSQELNIAFLCNQSQFLKHQIRLLIQNPLELLYLNNLQKIQQLELFSNPIQNQIARKKNQLITIPIKNVKLEYNSEKQKIDQKSYQIQKTMFENRTENQDQNKNKVDTLTNHSSVQKSSEIQKQFQNSITLHKKIQKRTKGQTKNLPKNFGKAIISFIQKQKKKVQECLRIYNIKYDEFMNTFIEKKNNIQTISDLRELWISHAFEQPMRVLSNLFLRKYCFKYIFNSRVSTYNCHLKCKQKLKESIRTPYNFTNIKDF